IRRGAKVVRHIGAYAPIKGHTLLYPSATSNARRRSVPHLKSTPGCKMTTYFLSMSKMAVSRSNVLHVAAVLSSAIIANGYAGPFPPDPVSAGASPAATVDSPSPERTLLAQASGDDTMARCQQLFGLYDRLNPDGYAKPLDARMALEDCRKGNIARGVAALKRVLERAQIPVPPTESATAPR